MDVQWHVLCVQYMMGNAVLQSPSCWQQRGGGGVMMSAFPLPLKLPHLGFHRLIVSQIYMYMCLYKLHVHVLAVWTLCQNLNFLWLEMGQALSRLPASLDCFSYQAKHTDGHMHVYVRCSALKISIYSIYMHMHMHNLRNWMHSNKYVCACMLVTNIGPYIVFAIYRGWADILEQHDGDTYHQRINNG